MLSMQVDYGMRAGMLATFLVLVSLACARIKPAADLPVPRPCKASANLADLWTDSLPLVSDTSLQRVVGGAAALNYPANVALPALSGVVRARVVIDTMGLVVPGSGIIEAFNNETDAQVVCEAFPKLRFEPVVIDGHKAMVGLVHVPFTLRTRR